MKNKLSIKQRIKVCFILLVSGMLPLNTDENYDLLIKRMNERIKTDRNKMNYVDYGFGWQDCMDEFGIPRNYR